MAKKGVALCMLIGGLFVVNYAQALVGLGDPGLTNTATLSGGVSVAAPIAADDMCPAATDTLIYSSDPAKNPVTYDEKNPSTKCNTFTENGKTYTNCYGIGCYSNLIKGFCDASHHCKGMSCYDNVNGGEWKTCAKTNPNQQQACGTSATASDSSCLPSSSKTGATPPADQPPPPSTTDTPPAPPSTATAPATQQPAPTGGAAPAPAGGAASSPVTGGAAPAAPAPAPAQPSPTDQLGSIAAGNSQTGPVSGGSASYPVGSTPVAPRPAGSVVSGGAAPAPSTPFPTNSNMTNVGTMPVGTAPAAGSTGAVSGGSAPSAYSYPSTFGSTNQLPTSQTSGYSPTQSLSTLANFIAPVVSFIASSVGSSYDTVSNYVSRATTPQSAPTQTQTQPAPIARAPLQQQTTGFTPPPNGVQYSSPSNPVGVPASVDQFGDLSNPSSPIGAPSSGNSAAGSPAGGQGQGSANAPSQNAAPLQNGTIPQTFTGFPSGNGSQVQVPNYQLPNTSVHPTLPTQAELVGNAAQGPSGPSNNALGELSALGQQGQANAAAGNGAPQQGQAATGAAQQGQAATGAAQLGRTLPTNPANTNAQNAAAAPTHAEVISAMTRLQQLPQAATFGAGSGATPSRPDVAAQGAANAAISLSGISNLRITHTTNADSVGVVSGFDGFEHGTTFSVLPERPALRYADLPVATSDWVTPAAVAVEIGTPVEVAIPKTRLGTFIDNLHGGWARVPTSPWGQAQLALALAQARSDYVAMDASVNAGFEADAHGLCDDSCHSSIAILQQQLPIQLGDIAILLQKMGPVGTPVSVGRAAAFVEKDSLTSGESPAIHPIASSTILATEALLQQGTPSESARYVAAYMAELPPAVTFSVSNIGSTITSVATSIWHAVTSWILPSPDIQTASQSKLCSWLYSVFGSCFGLK